MEDWKIFSTESLRRILRILLQLKCSSSCGGSMESNNGSRWPLVVMGGGKIWFQGLGGVLEKRRVKNHVFHAEEHIYNLQISLSENLGLVQLPLRQGSLSGPKLAQRNPLSGWNCTQRALARSAYFPLQLKLRLARHSHLERAIKLLFSKSQRSECGNMSQEALDKM